MYRIMYRFLVPGWSAKPLVSAYDRIMGTHTSLQPNAGLWEPYDGRLSRTVLREREVSLSCCQVFLGGLGQVLRLGCLVGGLGFEHGEDDVAAASGDADHGGVVAFALVSVCAGSGRGRRGSCWVATKAAVNRAFLRRWLPPRGLRDTALRPDCQSTGASPA